MKVSAGILAGFLAATAAGEAGAAVLTATPFGSFKSLFTITFTDQNNNRRFDLLTDPFTFSGVTFDDGSPDARTFNGILGVPLIAGITTATAPADFGDPLEEWIGTGYWRFSAASGPFGEGQSIEWTYDLTGLPDPAVVPLPAGLPLLLAAVGALALLRRRAVAA